LPLGWPRPPSPRALGVVKWVNITWSTSRGWCVSGTCVIENVMRWSERKETRTMAIQRQPGSTIPETIGRQFSVDSLQSSVQDASGANLLAAVDPVLKHLTNRLFPTHGPHHLAAKQVTTLRSRLMRTSIPIAVDGDFSVLNWNFFQSSPQCIDSGLH